MKEGRGDDRDGGWGIKKSHSEKKGWAKQDGRASCFVLWEKNFMQKHHREENKQAGTRRRQLLTTSHF